MLSRELASTCLGGFTTGRLKRSQTFWAKCKAGDDLATQRLGDSGALEIFAQQSGNNVVLSFESEAFAGNAVNTDDIVEVTLTGVSLENLSLSADGFITVA